jgi:hypothetical protein
MIAPFAEILSVSLGAHTDFFAAKSGANEFASPCQ